MTSKEKPATGQSGRLYLVATPIGNLEDISLRALRILREADLIACEDTRQTQKLLSHYDIHKPLESYHAYNEMTRAPELVIKLEEGAQVALVSDAGTPAISDPGLRLVSLCVRHHIPVIPIPGPSALVAALVASGLATEEFTFIGFLPARAGERRKALQALRAEPRTLVFYEAPHRLAESLTDVLDVLGNRPAVIAREVTKMYEEFLRGDLDEVVTQIQKKPPRGEITVLIGRDDGRGSQAAAIVNEPLSRRVQTIMTEQNMDQKAALKQAAKERGLTRREAYKQMLAAREE